MRMRSNCDGSPVRSQPSAPADAMSDSEDEASPVHDVELDEEEEAEASAEDSPALVKGVPRLLGGVLLSLGY